MTGSAARRTRTPVYLLEARAASSRSVLLRPMAMPARSPSKNPATTLSAVNSMANVDSLLRSPPPVARPQLRPRDQLIAKLFPTLTAEPENAGTCAPLNFPATHPPTDVPWKGA